MSVFDVDRVRSHATAEPQLAWVILAVGAVLDLHVDSEVGIIGRGGADSGGPVDTIQRILTIQRVDRRVGLQRVFLQLVGREGTLPAGRQG